ncbi:MAG: GHKL domain-containing protein [bacterium]|nr:GHKL domain-containing protein [bacterium]
MNKMSWLIIAGIILYLYNVFYFNYAINLLNTRVRKRTVLLICPIVVSLFVTLLLSVGMQFPLSNIITFLFYIIVFLFAFKDSFYNILILCGNNLFHVCYVRHFTIELISVCFHTSEYEIVQSFELSLWSLCITRAIMMAMALIVIKLYGYTGISRLLKCKRAIISIFLVLSVLLLLMINSYYINYYPLDDGLRKMIALCNGVLIAAGYYCLFVVAIKSTKWIEKENKYEIACVQLKYQQKLYKNQQEHQKVLRMYNHDYKAIMSNVVSYLNCGDIDGAKKILYQFETKIDQLNSKVKRYSNHLLADSILCSLANVCKEEGIEFCADCYIPEKLAITEFELGRIINNMKSNAYEACKRQEAGEKQYISFKSYRRDNNFILYAKNSYNGKAVMTGGKLLTSKEDRRMHGIGVESIRQTVEGAGGMVLLKPDNAKKEFQILVKLPC